MTKTKKHAAAREAWTVANQIAALTKENNIEEFGPKILDLMRGQSADVFWELDNYPGRYRYMDDRFYMLRQVRNHSVWGKKLFAGLKR